jgi:short-subunit dehydrogenase
VRPAGVTVTSVCPGPVNTPFLAVIDFRWPRWIPKLLWADAERVAEEALSAADAGRRVVVPGGWRTRAAFVPNRHLPRAVVLPVARRLTRR